MSITSSANDIIRQCFRGALIGALVGDCYGAPFEYRHSADPSTLLDDIDRLSKNKNILMYTDDTAMTISTCSSLIKNKGLNARNLAKQFSESYFRQPRRGYGAAVRTVFTSLRDTDYLDPFGPAASQFDGKGSYGNGAAMRCIGIGLFAQRTNMDAEAMLDLSENCARITHSHEHGINGASLLVMAVRYVLKLDDNDLDENSFLDYLIQAISEIENEKDRVFSQKLKLIKQVLRKTGVFGTDVTQSEMVQMLGNDVSAQNSVPLAIYSFLRGNSKFTDSYRIENEFLRTLHWAVSCGGDTDTIASMACGLCGAYLGLNKIPEQLYKNCEAWQEVMNLADQLFCPTSTEERSPQRCEL